MPGPRNQKKKRNAHNKKDRKLLQQQPPPTSSKSPSPTPAPATPPSLSEPIQDVSGEGSTYSLPPQPHHDIYQKEPDIQQIVPPPIDEHEQQIPPMLLQKPFIYDPGNGPRVKDPRAFLSSRFAAPPSFDDELCAEFAEEAVLQMLCTVLPEETALILWYNKSRRSSRICPACQRLYRLGDILPDHLAGDNGEQRDETRASPYLAREQELSGLCSPVCFILAAYNYPGAIRSTWGRMAEELDDATWDLLDAPHGPNAVQDLGLGMLLKMTRCHDLGLGQLFFPDLELDRDGSDEGSGEGSEETVRETEYAMTKTSVEAHGFVHQESALELQMAQLQVVGGGGEARNTDHS
ncbi:hypothetical protein C8Q73DRAFT_714618 [Cubamyces lactineus]|nr:hypothetical protein C8Q73DRAFT_714618 [Cubamyces lactineus]